MSLGEFEFLVNLKKNFSLKRIGDDCAVFPKDSKSDYLITSDLLVEDVDFRRAWVEPGMLGFKALAVSCSDIFAMGGTPLYSLVSLGLPTELWESDFKEEFFDGHQEFSDIYGVELIGGDISKTETDAFIDSTVVGTVPRNGAIKRSGAKVGDLICVSGTLGGAAAGLRLLENGYRISDSSLEEPMSRLISKQLAPTPSPIADAFPNITSMIDISDGLSGDLTHICEASEVGAKIYAERLPMNPDLAKIGLSEEQILQYALHGGEDFEMLFTFPEKKISSAQSKFVTVVGEITETVGIIELTENGIPRILTRESHLHF